MLQLLARILVEEEIAEHSWKPTTPNFMRKPRKVCNYCGCVAHINKLGDYVVRSPDFACKPKSFNNSVPEVDRE